MIAARRVSWVLVMLLGAASVAQGQLTVKDARALSRRTGRPILAVAGTASCANCRELERRLSSDASLAPLVSQFIPVKIAIDENPAIWRAWTKDFGSPGNATPLVYVIRGDGKKLVGKSGALRGQELPQMLQQTLAQSGRGLTDAQAQQLEAVVQEARQAVDSGDAAGAIATLLPLAKVAPLGELGSTAKSAVEADQLVGQLTEQGKHELEQSAQALLDTPSTAHAVAYARAHLRYGKLPALDQQRATLERQIKGRPDLTGVVGQAQQLERGVLLASSPRTKPQGMRLLEGLANQTANAELALLAQQELARLRKPAASP